MGAVFQRTFHEGLWRQTFFVEMLWTVGLLLAVMWTYWWFRIRGPEEPVVAFLPPLWILLAIVADYFSLWKTRILLTSSRLLDSGGLMALAVIFGDTLSTMVMFLAIILTPSLGFLLFVILSEPLQTID